MHGRIVGYNRIATASGKDKHTIMLEIEEENPNIPLMQEVEIFWKEK
jgi:hypothetical protein